MPNEEYYEENEIEDDDWDDEEDDECECENDDDSHYEDKENDPLYRFMGIRSQR